MPFDKPSPDISPKEPTKTFFKGAHRSREPSETLERVRPYLPVMGITRIANVTGLDRLGIPVTMALRPNSRSVATSQGKGTTLEAAMASAVMESIETYHAEHITLPLKYASHEEMRYTHAMAEIEHLPFQRDSCFHSYLQMLWIEGTNLFDGATAWVPYELVHTNYTRPLPPGSGSFLATSNGLASGNNLQEAMCHAICELVERDAMALWAAAPKSERPPQRINLETVDNYDCRDMLERFARAGVDVAAWDITSDIGVASMLVWIMENGSREIILGRPSVGAGCHPVRDIALSRALSEAAQERLTLIAGSRDDLKRSDYDSMDFSHVFKASGSKDFADVPTHLHTCSEEDVQFLLKRLKHVGIDQVLLFDLSKEPFGDIAVARIVIPGLEGVADDPRYVPGIRVTSRYGGAS